MRPRRRFAERFARIDWTFWGIVAFGALLRFLFLSMKPPHFDEGINGWFVDQMMKTGFYRYDPTNYHGPLHFYILFLSQALFGRHIWALRLPVVLASIGSIFVTLKFEPFVGRTVSRIAALAMAISPAFIFYGRYSIHEVWLLLFSMLFVLGLLGLWRLGTRGYLWCVGIGIAGMILTKETYIIHIGSALIAAGVLWVSHRLIPMSDLKRARQQWDLADLAMVTGHGHLFHRLLLFRHVSQLAGAERTLPDICHLVSDGFEGQRARKAVALLARTGDALRMAGLYWTGPLSGVSIL